MIFCEKLITQADDFDVNGKMLPNAILTFFENAANHHSAFVNDDIGSANGISWILTEWRVEICQTPRENDELSIKTWTTGAISHFKADRELLMLDSNENVLVKAEAKLALLDVKKGKPVVISAEKMEKYVPETKKVFDCELPSLKSCAAFDECIPIHLRRSDIDFNGHVHNTKYMDFALEAIPEEVYAQNEYSSFRIVYKHALTLEDETRITQTKTDMGYTMCIYSEEKLCCIVEMNIAHQ